MVREAEGRRGELEDPCGPGQGPEVVGSRDPSGNKVAAWLCAHTEGRPGWGSVQLRGTNPSVAFLPRKGSVPLPASSGLGVLEAYLVSVELVSSLPDAWLPTLQCSDTCVHTHIHTHTCMHTPQVHT